MELEQMKDDLDKAIYHFKETQSATRKAAKEVIALLDLNTAVNQYSERTTRESDMEFEDSVSKYLKNSVVENGPPPEGETDYDDHGGGE